MSREIFLEKLSVSRETLQRLDTFVGLLAKWSRAINLIGPIDVDEMWQRHILDSAQLTRHVPDNVRTWLDLGSGAGLPGLVCALIMHERAPALSFDLVDSDQRKAAFLREAARQTGVAVTVHADRAEGIPQRPYDLITARALAPLPRLLRLAAPFVAEGTMLLLHKGRSVTAELTEARTNWHIEADLLPSLSDPAGTILKISRLWPLT